MKKIYLNYDQQGLDSEYDLRPLVPCHPRIFDRYIRDSEVVTKRLPCSLDVSYGLSPNEKLDIFTVPNNIDPAPVLVFIHGGYWRNKDKSDFRYLAPAFTSAGINFVLLNYTLAPNASMDQIVDENRSAILWLYNNILDFGGDPKKIHISGHSAGGHLVAMLMATDWEKMSNGVISENIIQGCTSISGIFDLEPIRLSYLNASLKLDKEIAQKNSPIFLSPFSDIPLILTLGGEETFEYHRQQEAFKRAWGSSISNVTVLDMPGLHHYDVVDHLGMPGSALYRTVLDQITRTGKC